MRYPITKEFIFIFLAIIGQLFLNINFSFINLYLNKIQQVDSFFAGDQIDLTYWILLTTLGRISGAFCIGKYADKFGFFKSILVISQAFILLSVLCVVFCFASEFGYEINQSFYFLKFCHCFLEPAALVLPCLYLLDRSPEPAHYRLSAVLIGGVFIAKFASYYLIDLPPALIKNWYIFPLAAALISWIFYYCLYKHSEQETLPIANSLTMPLGIKILNALFGAACAAGVFYHYQFVSYYSVNINIVESRFDLGCVIYYVLCGLFLVPAAKLCEKFGLFRVVRISLGLLFCLGINFVLASPTATMYVVQQLLFSFFSALFIAPILVFLHRLYKNFPSALDTMFWFMLGFSGCAVLAFFEQQLAQQKGFAGIGWCVYSASICLCLIAIYKFRSYAILGAQIKI